MITSNLDDKSLQQILTATQVIAVVGHSDKPYRPSYQIAQFLREKGYQVYPVNPNKKEINGYQSYSSLMEIPATVDLVNVFRRSEYLPEIVDSAIAQEIKTVWAQSGIIHEQAAQKADAAGLTLVMDRCIKVEYSRLIG